MYKLHMAINYEQSVHYFFNYILVKLLILTGNINC